MPETNTLICDSVLLAPGHYVCADTKERPTWISSMACSMTTPTTNPTPTHTFSWWKMAMPLYYVTEGSATVYAFDEEPTIESSMVLIAGIRIWD